MKIISSWKQSSPKDSERNADLPPLTHLGFPGGSVKNLPANAGDTGSIPWSGRPPGEGNSNPLQYSCHGKSHGQRSLAGYSPWVIKSQTRVSTYARTHMDYLKNVDRGLVPGREPSSQTIWCEPGMHPGNLAVCLLKSSVSHCLC